MTGFGDYDPEDAFDIDDDPELQLDVIEHTLADIRYRHDGRFAVRAGSLRHVIEVADISESRRAQLLQRLKEI